MPTLTEDVPPHLVTDFADPAHTPELRHIQVWGTNCPPIRFTPELVA